MSVTGAGEAAVFLAEKADEVVRACRGRGWSLSWSARGTYLFLESAELIEALRGKGGSTPTAEAADVLLVFLSIVGANGIGVGSMLEEMDRKLEGIRNGTVGAGPDAVRP